MSWCWIARLPIQIDGALASAQLTDSAGDPVGIIAAWPAGRKPVAEAVRVDERVVDPGVLSRAGCYRGVLTLT